jgi:molybdate transport system substrate-binding protein
MDSGKGIARLALIFFCMMVPVPKVRAADIIVMCTTAMRTVMQDLVPDFERTTGHKVVLVYGVGKQLQEEISSGALFDVAVLTGEPYEALNNQGKVSGKSTVRLARIGVDVGIHAGGKKYNIGTVDAFQQMLREASSIVYAKQGASGIYFAELLKRLGMQESLSAKLLAAPSGDAVGAAVAARQAEVGILPASELLPVPGVEVLGPFPAEIQDYTYIVAGISGGAAHAGPARQLLEFLSNRRNRNVYVRRALEPLP